MNVQTKLGKEFLKIVDSSFPVGNPLHGKINRHNVKLSYRTMPNMKTQINRHNARLRRGTEPEVDTGQAMSSHQDYAMPNARLRSVQQR